MFSPDVVFPRLLLEATDEAAATGRGLMLSADNRAWRAVDAHRIPAFLQVDGKSFSR